MMVNKIMVVSISNDRAVPFYFFFLRITNIEMYIVDFTRLVKRQNKSDLKE